jgi:hypothetical protein
VGGVGERTKKGDRENGKDSSDQVGGLSGGEGGGRGKGTARNRGRTARVSVLGRNSLRKYVYRGVGAGILNPKKCGVENRSSGQFSGHPHSDKLGVGLKCGKVGRI